MAGRQVIAESICECGAHHATVTRVASNGSQFFVVAIPRPDGESIKEAYAQQGAAMTRYRAEIISDVLEVEQMARAGAFGNEPAIHPWPVSDFGVA